MGLREETKQTKPYQSPEIEAYLNLRRTAHMLSGQVESLLRSHGLTETQYNVLRILRGAGPEGLPSLELGRRLVASVPDITRLVDRMEKAGLVRRVRSTDDRRVSLVVATPHGLELATDLYQPLVDFHLRQLGHLTHEELAQLNLLLEKARCPLVAEAAQGDA